MSDCSKLDKRTKKYKDCIEAEKQAEAAEAKADGLARNAAVEADNLEDYNPEVKRTGLKPLKTEKAEVKVGAGDIVEKAAKALKIDKLMPKDKDCGCQDRKVRYNFITVGKTHYDYAYPESYSSMEQFIMHINKNARLRFNLVKPFTKQTLKAWDKFTEHKGNLNNEHVALIHECYKVLFIREFKRLNCCYDQFITDINTVYKFYCIQDE